MKLILLLQLACAVTLIVIGIVSSNVAIVFIGVASAILSVLDKWSRYRRKISAAGVASDVNVYTFTRFAPRIGLYAPNGYAGGVVA